MNVVVRAARRDDAPAIVALIAALAEFESLPGPDAAQPLPRPRPSRSRAS